MVRLAPRDLAEARALSHPTRLSILRYVYAYSEVHGYPPTLLLVSQAVDRPIRFAGRVVVTLERLGYLQRAPKQLDPTGLSPQARTQALCALRQERRIAITSRGRLVASITYRGVK